MAVSVTTTISCFGRTRPSLIFQRATLKTKHLEGENGIYLQTKLFALDSKTNKKEPSLCKHRLTALLCKLLYIVENISLSDKWACKGVKVVIWSKLSSSPVCKRYLFKTLRAVISRLLWFSDSDAHFLYVHNHAIRLGPRLLIGGQADFP